MFISQYVGKDLFDRDFYIFGHSSIGVVGITRLKKFPYWHFQSVAMNGRINPPKVY